ncbi:MAG: D-tyrosyl-tRNA(Tyr) deacylase [Tenericutes bacterium]|nr:D-tyrosyl-tRNA(Tyr) deacylase [Mycoplasmatota bacterium]
MRVVVQRVKEASVTVSDKVVSKINKGYVLLVGIKKDDSIKEIEYVAKKVAKLRIFDDQDGKLNLSIKQIKGEVLSISQFTLYGETFKSNRPGFSEAMTYELANEMYLKFNEILRKEYELNVLEGVFGSHMDIALVNDGPVTIIIEKQNIRLS